jgi:hypothetical protein
MKKRRWVTQCEITALVKVRRRGRRGASLHAVTDAFYEKMMDDFRGIGKLSYTAHWVILWVRRNGREA